MEDEQKNTASEEAMGDAQGGQEACDTEATAEETVTAEATGETAAESGKEKKNRKDKKADKLQERIDELEDKVKRQLAEFENYRRRTDQEKSQQYEVGAKSVIEKILPVIDNFERGLATVPEEEKDSPFAQGMNMIYKQLMAELDKMDVKPIDATGKEFDPNLHNAVMQVEDAEKESGTVAVELQKGYTYRGSVVRPSMVSVVQ